MINVIYETNSAFTGIYTKDASLFLCKGFAFLSKMAGWGSLHYISMWIIEFLCKSFLSNFAIELNQYDLEFSCNPLVYQGTQ